MRLKNDYEQIDLLYEANISGYPGLDKSAPVKIENKAGWDRLTQDIENMSPEKAFDLLKSAILPMFLRDVNNGNTSNITKWIRVLNMYESKLQEYTSSADIKTPPKRTGILGIR